MTSSLLHHGASCKGLHSRSLPASVPRPAPRRTSALAALDAAALGSARAVEAMSQVPFEPRSLYVLSAGTASLVSSSP